MANPQLERGHTRIANEILEKVARSRFNGTQLRVLLSIWRYTYGFRRKEHEFTLSFLAEAISAARSQVDREVTALIERNVLEVLAGGNGRPRVLRFNKDFDAWLDPPPRQSKPKQPPASSTVAASPKKRGKKQTSQHAPDSTYYRMAEYFRDKLQTMAESIDFNHASLTKVDLQKCADEFRRLVEIDKVSDKYLIRDVINWVTADDFWRTNVLSAKKLRAKFPELALKMKAARGKGGNTKGSTGASMIDKLSAAQDWIEQGGDPYEFDPNG
ncbi:MAG: replication protein [Cohnella sp.]|nr:replication protein [Cohnella sp.]